MIIFFFVQLTHNGRDAMLKSWTILATLYIYSLTFFWPFLCQIFNWLSFWMVSKLQEVHSCPSFIEIKLKYSTYGWKRTIFCDSFVHGFKMADLLWSWQCKYHKNISWIPTFWLLTASPSSNDCPSNFLVTYLRLIFCF